MTFIKTRQKPAERKYRPCMPLHYVDPHKKRNRWYTAFESFIRSRSGEFSTRHLFSHIDPWLYRATGGRYPAFLGALATAPLMTTGAKSGQPRLNQDHEND